VRRKLESLRRPDPPCSGPLPADKGTTWVEPALVCEVEYTEWTDEGLLRQPIFLRFRDDKRPEECVRRAAVDGRSGGQPVGGAGSSARPAT